MIRSCISSRRENLNEYAPGYPNSRLVWSADQSIDDELTDDGGGRTSFSLHVIIVYLNMF